MMEAMGGGFYNNNNKKQLSYNIQANCYHRYHEAYQLWVIRILIEKAGKRKKEWVKKCRNYYGRRTFAWNRRMKRARKITEEKKRRKWKLFTEQKESLNLKGGTQQNYNVHDSFPLLIHYLMLILYTLCLQHLYLVFIHFLSIALSLSSVKESSHVDD